MINKPFLLFDSLLDYESAEGADVSVVIMSSNATPIDSASSGASPLVKREIVD